MKTLLLVLGLADLASTIVVNNAAARCPLTDAEAEDVCGALKSRGIHFTAHPTECAAFVQCDGVTRATVMAVPEGTIWDNVVSTPVHLQAGSCAQSPCTTQRNISDCSSCFGYLTCKNNQVVSARCPDGQSFNRTRSQCAPDVTCVKGGIDATERLVSCVQIPNTSLYRKTAVLLGTQYNVDVSCSAGTVMNTTMCVCVSSNVRICPITLGDIQNLSFNGRTSAYTIEALDTNELAGNFTFNITSLTVSNSVLGVISLASNSRAGEPGCERPTFELVLDTNRRTVILTVVTVEPKTTSVSAPIPCLQSTTTVNEIRVERRGGIITIFVNGIQVIQYDGLGTDRLASTYCGLDIGNSNKRISLQGQINRVKLVREC